MARQRFIWPDLWKDPIVARLKPDELLFFIGCFSNADDEGRLLADPVYLRATIFPYQDFSLRKVTQIRDRVASGCANLELYEVDGVSYFSFRKWTDHQKPKYPQPSKLPAPPNSGNVSGTMEKDSRNASEILEEPSGNDGETFPPRVGQGRVGLGKDVLPADRSEVRRNGLPVEHELQIAKLLEFVGEHDEATAGTIRGLSRRLPEGALAKVLESACSQSGIKNRAAYVVGSLKSEISERVTV